MALKQQSVSLVDGITLVTAIGVALLSSYVITQGSVIVPIITLLIEIVAVIRIIQIRRASRF